MTYESREEAKARRAGARLQSARLRAQVMDQRAAFTGLRREPNLTVAPSPVTQEDWGPMGTDKKKDWAAQLQAAGALARERFSAVQGAYKAVETRHDRGDYSPSPEFRQRLDEFRSAASEVRRLVTEIGSPAGPAYTGRME